MPALSDQQLEAFYATHYQVDASDAPFTLRIGQHSAAMARLHEQYEVRSSAYLTA